jgi:hypothetical protein
MATNKIPLETLRYATVVVNDAKTTARNYADFYGIERWNVTHATPERLQAMTIRGRVPTAPPPYDLNGPVPVPGQYGFISAIGSSPSGNVTFQIVQPTSGLSTFEEFLVTRGEGVHSIFATVLDAKSFGEMRAWLATEGVTVAQSYRLGAADFYYFDMRKLLGSFYIQVVVPQLLSSRAESTERPNPDDSDWEQTIPIDETWDFSSEVARPRDVKGASEALGITHFGVVVDNLSEKLPNFAKLFGQPVWRGMHWRTAPGSLEDTTNNGLPVVHGYFTGRSDLGENRSGLPWGFEVIQPTAGPSHYKENYLNLLGPGIHHVDVRIPMKSWDEWERINGWLGNDFGAPTCMSGWLRNHSALFHYQDTRKRLGYVTEISGPRNGPAGKGWQPDYWYDFSALAT